MIKINPFLFNVKFEIDSGKPNESKLGIEYGNFLKVAAKLPLCLNILTLNLLTPFIPIEKSISLLLDKADALSSSK